LRWRGHQCRAGDDDAERDDRSNDGQRAGFQAALL
jgi:hypothetical protein